MGWGFLQSEEKAMASGIWSRDTHPWYLDLQRACRGWNVGGGMCIEEMETKLGSCSLNKVGVIDRRVPVEKLSPLSGYFPPRKV